MLPKTKAVNLKTVAARVGLAPCSVSAVLNNTEAARAIPQKTKDRVYRAAAELNYRPNILARSLRTKRTRMVAVIAPSLSRPGVARVVAAAQHRLDQSGYLLVLATYDGGDPSHLCAQLQQRGIEGVISIDVNLPAQMTVPVTSVDLGYKTSAMTVSDQTQVWLPELGTAAAEAIMRQIENEGSSQRLQIQAMPAAYVDMQSIDGGFSAAESA
ncbi:MAG: LacI family transcriptional regulator [Acidobacteriia bacterium]|nr:LacI family transcriptional regulator [Terriglobia bacterium]